jgi:metal-dependent hydrolase (beta-lactamase superfamily II)
VSSNLATPTKQWKGLANGWGLSAWIENQDGPLLFDTGVKGEILEQNMSRLGVEKIAPSHCTGNSAIKTFRHEWGTNFVNLNIGDTFEV